MRYIRPNWLQLKQSNQISRKSLVLVNNKPSVLVTCGQNSLIKYFAEVSERQIWNKLSQLRNSIDAISAIHVRLYEYLM